MATLCCDLFHSAPSLAWQAKQALLPTKEATSRLGATPR